LLHDADSHFEHRPSRRGNRAACTFVRQIPDGMREFKAMLERDVI